MPAVPSQTNVDQPPSRRERLALVAILLAAFTLFRANNDFPSRYHRTEPANAAAALAERHDARQPALVLAIARAACELSGAASQEAAARVGRTCTALFGAGLVFFAWCFARETRGAAPPLWTAAATALSPLVAVHAHYFSHDIALACFAVASLAAFLRWLRTGARRDAMLAGIAVGLAMASHFGGALLILLWGPAVLLRPPPRRMALRDAANALLMTGGVFTMLSCTAVTDWAGLADGLQSALARWVHGDDLPIPLRSSLLTFHLRHSLGSGLTPPLALAAVAGLALPLARWRTACPAMRLTIAYTVAAYLAVELSPLKPFPDFMRFMLPLVPPLAWSACELIHRHVPRGPAHAPAWLSLLLLVHPAIDSLRLVQNLGRDTRAEAEAWLAAHLGPAVCETYATSGERVVPSIVDVDLAAAPERRIRHLVASSFTYERYFYAESIAGMDADVRRRAAAYHLLFTPKFKEIRPAYRSFAFSNPTIRILFVRGTRVVDRYF